MRGQPTEAGVGGDGNEVTTQPAELEALALKVAKSLGIGTGTVQRISKERAMSPRGRSNDEWSPGHQQFVKARLTSR